MPCQELVLRQVYRKVFTIASHSVHILITQENSLEIILVTVEFFCRICVIKCMLFLLVSFFSLLFTYLLIYFFRTTSVSCGGEGQEAVRGVRREREGGME